MSSTKTTKLSRAVRFSEEPVVSVHRYSYQGGDANDFWVDSDAIRQTKSLRNKLAAAWDDKGLSVLLDGMFSNPNQSHLDAFTQLAGDDYMRGSESQVSRALSKERSAARKQLLQAVIDREVQLKLSGRSPEQVAQDVAALSAKHSQTARTFASMMGRADELADKLGEDSTPALEIVYIMNPKAAPMFSKMSLANTSGWLASSVKNMIGNRQA